MNKLQKQNKQVYIIAEAEIIGKNIFWIRVGRWRLRLLRLVCKVNITIRKENKNGL